MGFYRRMEFQLAKEDFLQNAISLSQRGFSEVPTTYMELPQTVESGAICRESKALSSTYNN